MKNSKLKFSEYMQNISRSKSFGKFVFTVRLTSIQLTLSIVPCLRCLKLDWSSKIDNSSKNFNYLHIYKLLLIYYLFGHKAQGTMIKASLKEKGNEDGKKRNGVEMEINWRCGKD